MTEIRFLLTYAIEHLGSREVAKRLLVPEATIADWLAGDPVPDGKAQALADLVEEIDKAN